MILSRKLISLVLIGSLFLLTSCGLGVKERNLEFTISFDTPLKSSISFPRLGFQNFACLPKGKTIPKIDHWLVDAKSIFDVPWMNNTIEIVDGSNKIVGVPDSFRINMGIDYKCSITYKFSKLVIPTAPVRIQSASTSYGWLFPPSEWQRPYVVGQDTGGNY